MSPKGHESSRGEQPSELAYLDMGALKRQGRPSRWRRACLSVAPYARILVYGYVALWVATALLYQGLRSGLWVATGILGLACGLAALMGIAGRQWVRGETVGAWLPIVLLWRITWWLRLDDRDRRSIGAWRRTVRNWPPPRPTFQPPLSGGGPGLGEAIPFVYRAEESD